MQKQKRITLNADKRKVIADVFQDHFELAIQNLRKHGQTQYKKVSRHERVLRKQE